MAQIPMARARGEIRHAQDLITAACDLADKPDWERLRRDIAGGG